MSDAKHRMQSFGIGHLLGLAGGRVPVAKRLPVAYLYNGVRLPKLPEWDRETYPYAYIIQLNLMWKVWSLTVSSQPLTYDGGSVYRTGACRETGCNEKVTPLYWYYGGGSGSFSEEEIIDEPHAIVAPFWANHDIINTADGTVYLAASDPVPVYE